jgi:pimeloyl-ACP methyl ester carboxylesterase
MKMLGRRHRHFLRAMVVTTVALGTLPLGGAARAAHPDTSVHTVQVGNISLAYREVGHGRPLVLIQGSGAAMDVWDPLMVAALAEHHRVIEFDNRGVGSSTDDRSQPMTIDLLADDTAGLIRALHLGRPDVLGWSLGGFIAEDLAARHPRLVRRLVLVSSDPGGTHAVQAAPDVLALDARVTLGQATLDEILYLLFPPEGLDAGLAWLNRYFSQPGCCESVAYETGVRQLDAEYSAWYTPGGGVWDALPRLQPKTLVMAGLKDIDVPVRNARLLAARIPDPTLRLFAHTGHGLPLQRPIAVANAVDRFLHAPS